MPISPASILFQTVVLFLAKVCTLPQSSSVTSSAPRHCALGHVKLYSCFHCRFYAMQFALIFWINNSLLLEPTRTAVMFSPPTYLIPANIGFSVHGWFVIKLWSCLNACLCGTARYTCLLLIHDVILTDNLVWSTFWPPEGLLNLRRHVDRFSIPRGHFYLVSGEIMLQNGKWVWQ